MIKGELGKLDEALEENERRVARKKRRDWNSADREGGRGDLMEVVDEVLGFAPTDPGVRKEERLREALD